MGFYVIAPDLYDGHIAADAAQARALRERLGEAGPPRVSAALEVIKTHHRCTGKMGVVGWGMGGELAFHAATYRDDILAAVIFYGDPGAFLTILHANETPLLAFYGDDDADIPPAMLNRLSQAMSVSPASEHLVIFPGVANGFLDEESPHYHPQYAARAWKHMIGFLYDHLGAAPSASREHDPLG
jgi:carboxymethylenebutenolidase